jgi:hypothetical protein
MPITRHPWAMSSWAVSWPISPKTGDHKCFAEGWLRQPDALKTDSAENGERRCFIGNCIRHFGT